MKTPLRRGFFRPKFLIPVFDTCSRSPPYNILWRAVVCRAAGGRCNTPQLHTVWICYSATKFVSLTRAIPIGLTDTTISYCMKLTYNISKPVSSTRAIHDKTLRPVAFSYQYELWEGFHTVWKCPSVISTDNLYLIQQYSLHGNIIKALCIKHLRAFAPLLFYYSIKKYIYTPF